MVQKRDRQTEEILAGDPMAHKVEAFARAVQLALCKRDFLAAKAIIDNAQEELMIKPVTLSDHPVRIVPAVVADKLEDGGYLNIQSLLYATAEELRACPNMDDIGLRFILSGLMDAGFELNPTLKGLWMRVKFAMPTRNEKSH